MEDQKPFYTFWQIAEKWAKELKKSEIEVLQRLKRYSAYSTDGSEPVMIFWPTECFNAKGELNEITVFNANRLIKVTTQTKFSEDSHAVAVKLMNSAGFSELSVETKNAFNQFAIKREDFEKGCIKLGLPLPRFWFQQDDESGFQTLNPLTEASKVLASQRISERDKYLDEIMGHIREELKHATPGHTMINHLRL